MERWLEFKFGQKNSLFQRLEGPDKFINGGITSGIATMATSASTVLRRALLYGEYRTYFSCLTTYHAKMC